MTNPGKEVNVHFLQLVISLQAAAMQQMGKVASPADGKADRNLEMAQHSIDMLDMLLKKTEGNLSDDERQLLNHILHELRLNYVDEVNKEKNEAASTTDLSKKDLDESTNSAKTNEDSSN